MERTATLNLYVQENIKLLAKIALLTQDQGQWSFHELDLKVDCKISILFTLLVREWQCA